jgi:carbonic anhydrase
MGLVGAYHDIATRTVHFGELVTLDDGQTDLAA